MGNNMSTQTDIQEQDYYDKLLSDPTKLILKVNESRPDLEQKEKELKDKLNSIPDRFSADKPFTEHYLPRLVNFKATVEILKDLNAFDWKKINFISTVKYKLEGFPFTHSTITKEALNEHLDEVLNETKDTHRERAAQIRLLTNYAKQLDKVCQDEHFLALFEHESGANVLDQNTADGLYNQLYTSLENQYTAPAYVPKQARNPLPNNQSTQYLPRPQAAHQSGTISSNLTVIKPLPHLPTNT